MRAWAERGRARQAPRDAEFPLCMWVCLLCQSGFKEKFVCIVCCAVQLRTLCFVLTYHPSVLHKCYLIKRACVCAHGKAILPVNLHTVGIGAICPPLVAFRLVSYGWRGFFVSPFRAVDENSEPKLLCQEDTEQERRRWRGITGYALSEKFWFVFMCMCQTTRRRLTQRQKECRAEMVACVSKLVPLNDCSGCLRLQMAEHRQFLCGSVQSLSFLMGTSAIARASSKGEVWFSSTPSPCESTDGVL